MQENSNMNIVLVGMPGAGKSYIGGKLAKLLSHFSYVDIDFEIEKNENKKISEIFDECSEQHFRKLETETIERFSQSKNQIISVGGGALETPNNIQLLKKNGIIFYLRASEIEIYERIKNETHRPLLQKDFSLNKLRSILKKREKNYLRADFVIDTDKKRAYTILNDILTEYENYAAK